MNTVYSIISVGTKPQSDEKIGVGLICMTDNDVFFHVSKQKLSVILKLVPHSRSLIESSLQSLHEWIGGSQKHHELITARATSPISDGYLAYLDRYNNGVLQFSAPRTIDHLLNRLQFEELFRNMVFTEESFLLEVPKALKSIERYRRTYKPRFKAYVNTDFKVTNAFINELEFPLTIDLFGKNGAFCTGQSFDFSKPQISSLYSEAHAYLHLVDKAKSAERNTTCFLIGEEPNREDQPQHDLWNKLRQLSSLHYVPLSEIDELETYMKVHGVMPVV